MKKNPHLTILFSFLLIFLALCGCESMERGFQAVELEETPEEFIKISDEQMNDFPHLREAILSGKIVITPLEEYKKLSNLLEGTDNIQYMDKFYLVLFAT